MFGLYRCRHFRVFEIAGFTVYQILTSSSCDRASSVGMTGGGGGEWPALGLSSCSCGCGLEFTMLSYSCERCRSFWLSTSSTGGGRVSGRGSSSDD